MTQTVLEFEKPIAALQQQLQEMELLAHKSNIDVSDTVVELKKKIKQLESNTYKNLSRWQKVQLSRHPERPYTLDYIERITESYIELHGDRGFRDDPAIVGGFGVIEGKTFMIIGQQKGRNTKQRQYRNFGMASPEGYRKALRLMKMAEKFDKPILTLIDTPGAYPGLEAEERGQGEAIARNLKEMFMLKVPVIAVVIGEGASGGALGIAVGDKLAMLENTWFSVISPESCSSILWRSWDYKEQAAEGLKLSAQDMLSFKLIDDIISEPLGGADKDIAAMCETLKQYILSQAASLSKLKPAKRIEKRIQKFSQMGAIS